MSFLQKKNCPSRKNVKDSFGVNAEVFNTIAKEFRKQFEKKRVLENPDGWDEKIVTKFELVALPKVKKTK